MARGNCDGERKGASYTVKASRSGGDYSGTGQAPHYSNSAWKSAHPPIPSGRNRAFSQGVTREAIAHEVARGEHRED